MGSFVVEGIGSSIVEGMGSSVVVGTGSFIVDHMDLQHTIVATSTFRQLVATDTDLDRHSSLVGTEQLQLDSADRHQLHNYIIEWPQY